MTRKKYELQYMPPPDGKYEMPSLADFESGEISIPIVFSWDATGFGNQQFTTMVLNQ